MIFDAIDDLGDADNHAARKFIFSGIVPDADESAFERIERIRRALSLPTTSGRDCSSASRGSQCPCDR
jgi:hypothetical protein